MAESSTEPILQYSKYYLELDSDVKAIYEENIRMIGLVDPYCCLEDNATVAVSLLLNGMNGQQ